MSLISFHGPISTGGELRNPEIDQVISEQIAAKGNTEFEVNGKILSVWQKAQVDFGRYQELKINEEITYSRIKNILPGSEQEIFNSILASTGTNNYEEALKLANLLQQDTLHLMHNEVFKWNGLYTKNIVMIASNKMSSITVQKENFRVSHELVAKLLKADDVTETNSANTSYIKMKVVIRGKRESLMNPQGKTPIHAEVLYTPTFDTLNKAEQATFGGPFYFGEERKSEIAKLLAE